MNPRVYDLSLLAGVALIAGGVWARFGTAAACIVAGALVIMLTLLGR